MRTRVTCAAMLVVLVVACGGETVNPFATDGSGSTTTTTTLLGDTTTTSAEGIPDFFDLSSIEHIPPSTPLVGVDALLGGPADGSVSLALRATVTAAAIDLTGVEITVWPVTGTGESLLLVEFDETASAFADTEGPGDDLFAILLASPLVDDRSITRVVIRMRGTDDQGPYIFTFTAPTAAMRENLATGAAIPPEQLLMQLEREDGS